MMTPHNRPTLGAEETAAAGRVIASGWVAQGREVVAFENEICAFLGLPEGHAVALSSGTAALFMALWALEAKGKSVATPVYSCAAVRNAVLMAGAMPVYVDAGEGTPNIDLDQAAKEGAAIAIAAHMFGIPCRWDANRFPPLIVEDCAQAFGARVAGRPVGLSGIVGVFSFYATKMITSGGQGGMVVSRDRALIDGVRDYREFDCRDDRKPRFNFQLTDLQAAVGRVQLSRLDAFLARRREIHKRYAAAGMPLWPERLPADSEPCHYRAILRADDPAGVIAALQRAGVRAIVPVEEWELLDDAARFPRAQALSRELVSIPVYPSLSDGEIGTIVAAIASR
jgi:perosamine synthetase